MSKLPLLTRILCRWFWHSYRGTLNEHGALQWLTCTRCGERRDLIWELELTQ